MKMARKRMKDFRANRARGQAAVEFLLTFVLVFVFFLAIIEMILFIHTYNVLADAAKEGLRYAIVHGSSLTPTYQVGPTCGCLDIVGPAAPPGTIPGYNSGYGVV